MLLWKIAWKNIWRNKMRSTIILTAIALGLYGGLFGSALIRGMASQRIRTAIANETAHAQLHHPDFLLNKSIADTLNNVQSLGRILDTLDGLAAWSPRLKLTAMATSATTGTGVVINGIDPPKEKAVTKISTCIADGDGDWFHTPRRNSIVAGRALCEKLRLKLRSKIILTFQDAEGNVVSAAFKITGIYRSGNASFDETNVFVSTTDLAPLAGLTHGETHEIALLFGPGRDPSAYRSYFEQLVPAVSFLTWKELMPDLGLMDDFMNQMLYIILIVILAALCFGVVNTMMMAVLERTHELGMLLAVGMARWQIFSMIMLETLLLSLTGALAGMGCSMVTVSWLSQEGINLASFATGLEDMGYSAILYPEMSVAFYIPITLLVLAMALIAALLPARRAIRLLPVEAIRVL